MDLLEIRKWFIQDSGRFDLVENPVTCETDAGANKYINSGIRLIDRMLDHPKQNVVAERTLDKGSYSISLPRFQAINHVWIEVDDGVKYLSPLMYNQLQQKFPIGATEEGTPSVYALDIKRDVVDNAVDIFTTSNIFIMAPADREITVKIAGRFPSEKLSDNDHFNFWTVEHPETVVQAALYSLERFYRNTQGMRDHMEAIMSDIRGIDNDVVEQSVAETDQMDSSFNERTGRGRRYES